MKANPSRGILTLFRDARAARGRLQRPRGRARAARRLRARADPAHLADAVAAPGGARRRAACSSTPARCTSSRRSGGSAPRPRGVGPDEPGPRQRRHQPHQHRRPGLELRHLARVPGRGEGASPSATDCTITRLHSHIGSGTDPEVWKRVHADDARPGGAAARRGDGEPGRRLQGGAHARASTSADLADVGAHVRQRAARPSASATAARSTWRSSRARTSSPTPARSSRRCVDVVDTGQRRLPLRQARHRHDRGHAAVALRRPAPDRRARRGPRRGRRRLRRAVLRVGRHPHAGARRSRGAGAAPRAAPAASATWWSSAARAPTAPRCPPSTTTPTRRRPRSCSSRTARSALLRRRQAPEQVWANEV